MNATVSEIEEIVKAALFRNAELSERVLSLESEKASLEAEIKELRSRLSRFEIPEKDSHNSSIPPAKESPKAQAIRRTSSLRTPTGRPSGGQKGHKGSTLLMNDTCDDTTTHIPQYCSCCGKSLSGLSWQDMNSGCSKEQMNPAWFRQIETRKRTSKDVDERQGANPSVVVLKCS